MQIKRNLVSSDIEKKILTGLIVSDNYYKQVQKMLKKQYFKVSYIQTIYKWVSEYYNTYRENPGKEIQNIYNIEKENVKESDASIIGQFLDNLSNDYEQSNFNVDYLVDQTKVYFRERSLHLLTEEVQAKLARGKLEDAEQMIKEYNKVAQQTSSWFNPFDVKNIQNIFEEDTDKLFKLPDELGEMSGWLERDWLIAFMGPMKRGKCISGDSQIPLANGRIISIRDLVKSNKKENIISFNEKTQRFESVQISELFDNGIKNCYQITTKTGRKVSTTINHQYLTPSGWKYLEDIKKGDFIAVPKKIDFFGQNKIDEHLIKFLSYMMAEGGCTGTQPTFTNADKEINIDFEKCCDFLNVSYKIKGINHNLSKANPLLRQFGIMGCSAKSKLIPDIIMNACKENIAIFLRIFFTCDGSIYQEKGKSLFNIELTLANEKLIDQISHLLLQFGIVHIKRNNPSMFNGKQFPAWRISINDQESINLFLKEIGFAVPKSKQCFEVKTQRSFLDKFPFEVAKKFRDELKKECNGRPDLGKYPKGQGFYNRCGKSEMSSISYSINKKRSVMRQSFSKTKGTEAYNKYMNSDILWDEVLSIEFNGEIDTYDISVPDHYNFIANDIIVHNSWWLQELTIHALMSGLKVAYFSLEMNKKAVSKRIYKRIAVLANYAGEYKFPVFDCERNQDNTCEKSERTCSIGVKAPGGARPTWNKVKGYRPCIICKQTSQDQKTDYVKATWFNIHDQKYDIGTKNVTKKIKSFLTQYGNNLRIMAYPAFSASFDDIEADLDSLEYQENFIPHLVCIDYFDISNPGKNTGNLSERGKADHVWKRGKGFAAQRHFLMATVLQSNRPSISKKSLEQEDTSEDIRKLAHVDMLFGLNQTKEEKEENLMRLSVIAHRHEEFSFKGEVAVLQALALGQPLLFSGWHEEKGK